MKRDSVRTDRAATQPAATQPVMYRAIRQHPTVRKLYADRLIADGVLSAAEADSLVEAYRRGLDEGRPQARASLGMIGNKYTVDWSQYAQVDWTERVQTGVELKRLRALGERLTSLPEGLALHPRVAQVIANRRRMLAGEQPLERVLLEVHEVDVVIEVAARPGGPG